jgi:hypothetical protein
MSGQVAGETYTCMDRQTNGRQTLSLQLPYFGTRRGVFCNTRYSWYKKRVHKKRNEDECEANCLAPTFLHLALIAHI